MHKLLRRQLTESGRVPGDQSAALQHLLDLVNESYTEFDKRLQLSESIKRASKERWDELLKTEEQYKLFLKYGENAPGAIYQLQKTGGSNFIIPFASPGIVQIFEFSVEQLQANPRLCLERIDKNDLAVLLKNCRHAFRRSTVWEYSFRVYLPVKGTRWISGSARPERLHNRSIVWNGYLNDITEKKVADQIILLEKELSNSIIDNLPGIFCLYDKQGKMLRWNRNFEHLNGYTASEISQMHPFYFFNHQSRAMIKKLQAVRPAARLSGAEVIMVSKTNKQMHLYINSAMIQYEGSDCRLIIGIDISKRKRAEELLIEINKELEQKAEELKAISRYKTEFLANMSHELRTPLNSIMILSRILYENKSKNLGEKEVEFAEIIQKSGNDLLHLINEVLDLAKVESGKIHLNLKEHVLADFLRDIKATWTPMALEKGIKFRMKISPHLPEGIYTDIERVGQIMRNLLSNALKFTNTGGTIAVIVGIEPGAVISDRILKIQVKDNGIGIPEEKQEQIFLAFQQADGTTRRKYGGTGLGLSISRELIRQLSGEILLNSVEGKGSTFTVCLPV